MESCSASSTNGMAHGAQFQAVQPLLSGLDIAAKYVEKEGCANKSIQLRSDQKLYSPAEVSERCSGQDTMEET